jgi:phage tail-like protein
MVEIDGVVAAAFTECRLPVASIQVIEYREGADAANNIRKLPGLVKFGNLTLKRGLTNSLALWTGSTPSSRGRGRRRRSSGPSRWPEDASNRMELQERLVGEI